MTSVFRLALPALLAAAPALAYPSMVRHNYGSCAACHVDPSGGGQLAPYGRAQADLLVRWHLVKQKPEEQEVSPTANLLWFLEQPDVVNFSGNLRGGVFVRPTASSGAVAPLVMATDLYATVNVSRFVGHLTIGPGLRRDGMSSPNDPLRAALLPRCSPATQQCGPVALASREAWVGAKFADDAVMVRAGRLALPFGLRNDEHYTWVRGLSHTDLNLDQQTGLSVAYNSELLRGEVMGLLGNFSVGPDAYRERGYSAFAEYALAKNAYLGLSSLLTSAGADLATGLPTTRHAHGLFARWAPTELVALLAEGDLLVWQTPNALDRIGFAALVQADFEVLQGVHLMGLVESMHQGDGARGPSFGAWASAAWFALPHVQLRVDNILRLASSATGPGASYALLFQLHVFL